MSDDHKTRIENLAKATGGTAKPPLPPVPTTSAPVPPTPSDAELRLLIEKLFDFATAMQNGTREIKSTQAEVKASLQNFEETLPTACAESCRPDLLAVRSSNAAQRDELAATRAELKKLMEDLVGSTKSLFWVSLATLGALLVLIFKP